jgi:hypothetical protein
MRPYPNSRFFSHTPLKVMGKPDFKKFSPSNPLIPPILPYSPEPTYPDSICEVCEKPGKQMCQMCHAVHYCSNECHRTHFPIHQRCCKLLDSRESIRPGVAIDPKKQPLTLKEAGKVCTDDLMVLKFFYSFYCLVPSNKGIIAMLPLTDRSPNSYRTSIMYTLTSGIGSYNNLRALDQCTLSTPICILQVLPVKSAIAKGLVAPPGIRSAPFLLYQDLGVKSEGERKSPIRLKRDSPPLPNNKSEGQKCCIIIPPWVKPEFDIDLSGVIEGKECLYIVPGTQIYGILPKIIV